jgi:glutathione S-transferase
MAKVILWHFPISHFNEKARWALDWKRIPHERRVLGLSYFPRALWATGRGTLPILFLDGRAIGDSTRIIAQLERLQPDPPLYPSDPAARRRALELEDFFDEELGHALRTAGLGPAFIEDPDGVVAALSIGMGDGTRRWYRHGISRATIETAPAQVGMALERIAAELRPSGYLVGEHFSVADLTAAALLYPLAQPREFPYPLPPSPRATERARASFDDHVAIRWAREMYRRHRGTSAEVATPAASPTRVRQTTARRCEDGGGTAMRG